jgi:hypothetical protein
MNMTKAFERCVAVEERTDDDGVLIGDRVRVQIDDTFVNLYRENKLKHGKLRLEGAFDWDWQVDPDAGISLSIAAGHELLGALHEGLGAAKEEWETLDVIREAFDRIRRVSLAVGGVDPDQLDDAFRMGLRAVTNLERRTWCSKP